MTAALTATTPRAGEAPAAPAPFGRRLIAPTRWIAAAQFDPANDSAWIAMYDGESAAEAWEEARQTSADDPEAKVRVHRVAAVWSVPRAGVFEAAAACMEAHPEDVSDDREWQAEGADFQARPALSFLWDRLEEALHDGLPDGDRLDGETMAAMEEAVRWAYSEEEAAIEEEVWAALQ